MFNFNRVLVLVTISCSCLFGCDRNGSLGQSPNPLLRNMVGHWNHEAINASGLDHSAAGAKEQLGPVKSSRAEAIVHIAMFDAANAAVGQRYEPFLLKRSIPGASVEAAVAQAAYDTLSVVFPSQKDTFAESLKKDLAGISEGKAKQDGILLGAEAARLILEDRRDDGSDTITQNTPYEFNPEPGYWRVDPINPNQKPLGANWFKVRPFVIKDAEEYRSPPPPALDSEEFAKAYEEVFHLGGDGVTTPTVRTEEQTDIGIFWAYDGTPSLCAPPRLYNQIAMQIAADQGVEDLVDLARLLALVNVSMADAGISSWETKYFYSLARPVTAIREAGLYNNDLVVADPGWIPLGAPASNLNGPNFTPPFPAYVSGHATFGGALFQSLRNYFGHDNVPFTLVSDELNGVTLDNQGNPRPLKPRAFASFSEAEEENGQSRIYLGIHWSFDKVEGIVMGNKVANAVFNSTFRPK